MMEGLSLGDVGHWPSSGGNYWLLGIHTLLRVMFCLVGGAGVEMDWERRGEADLRRRRKENINAGAPLDVGILLNFLHTPPHEQPLLYLRRISNCD
jgi:hypothetical protein